MAFRITSRSFAPGEHIPKRFTGEGEDVAPELSWSGVPPEAKQLALICDDPDAPREKPFVHWLLAGIPVEPPTLREGVDSDGTTKGKNDFGNLGYGGPMPPKGHGVHHYHFKLYALDAPAHVKGGFSKEDLLAAMKGHVVAEAEVVGTYERR